MTTMYFQGFCDKCAELGVKPEQAAKMARFQSEQWGEPIPKPGKEPGGTVPAEVPPKPVPQPRKTVLKDLPEGSGARAGAYNKLKTNAQQGIDNLAKARARR